MKFLLKEVGKGRLGEIVSKPQKQVLRRKAEISPWGFVSKALPSALWAHSAFESCRVMESNRQECRHVFSLIFYKRSESGLPCAVHKNRPRFSNRYTRKRQKRRKTECHRKVFERKKPHTL